MADRATVVIVDCKNRAENGCIDCRKIYNGGKLVLGLIVGRRRYFIGDSEAVCCGKKKDSFILVFESNEEAEKAQAKVMEMLAREGTTKSLNLLEWAVVASTDTTGN